MTRQIVKIDEEKCNGCGLCAAACHEGAIGMVNNKAKLLREDYCDGLGNCLPVCPTGAISFEQREAPAFDEAAALNKTAVKAEAKPTGGQPEKLACGCPGTQSKIIKRAENEPCNCGGHTEEKTPETLPCGCPGTQSKSIKHNENEPCACGGTSCQENENTCESAEKNTSKLSQWPVQIKLVPVNAPYFNNANLLVSADCAAYAYGDFHNRFIKNKITLIGCPKLDMGDYADKLTEIIKNNNIQSVTVVRMEVPCCGGLEHAVKTALQNSGKFIPWQVVTIGTDGEILDE